MCFIPKELPYIEFIVYSHEVAGKPDEVYLDWLNVLEAKYLSPTDLIEVTAGIRFMQDKYLPYFEKHPREQYYAVKFTYITDSNITVEARRMSVQEFITHVKQPEN